MYKLDLWCFPPPPISIHQVPYSLADNHFKEGYHHPSNPCQQTRWHLGFTLLHPYIGIFSNFWMSFQFKCIHQIHHITKNWVPSSLTKTTVPSTLPLESTLGQQSVPTDSPSQPTHTVPLNPELQSQRLFMFPGGGHCFTCSFLNPQSNHLHLLCVSFLPSFY